MKINLYEYTDAPNIINKTLPEPDEKNGAINDSFNIDNPIFKFTEFSLKYNYCYVDALNRYYWIDDITIDPNGLYIVTMSIDVLMTFKDEITQGTATITQNKANDFNRDEQTTPETLFNSIELTNPFNYEKGSIVLIGLNTGGN